MGNYTEIYSHTIPTMNLRVFNGVLQQEFKQQVGDGNSTWWDYSWRDVEVVNEQPEDFPTAGI